MSDEQKCIKTSSGYRSGLSDQAITLYLLAQTPDVVGISNNFTAHAHDVLELTALVKGVLPSCVVVVGGAHATFAHETLISNNHCIDVVVRGEGEVTFWKLLRAVYSDESFDNLKGITFRKAGNLVVQEPEPLIEDLDSLPMPDRSLVDYGKYLEISDKSYFVPYKKPVGTIVSSRGCMFNCVFCSTQKVWGNKWRTISAENVVREIEHLYYKYGVREISFEDDQFMGSKQRVIDICDLIIEKKLAIGLIAPAGISPALITEEVLDRMAKAGFHRICYSVDVGTEKSREYVGKPVKLDRVRELVRMTNRKGLWTYATFVIGFPDETEDDILDTIKFAYDIKTDFVRFYIAQPHLGSRLYEIYLEQGIIEDAHRVESDHGMYQALYPTKYVSADRLEELRDFAESGYLKKHLLHLLEPSYLIHEFLPKISSARKFQYFLRMVLSRRNLA